MESVSPGPMPKNLENRKRVAILIPAYGNIPSTFLPVFIGFILANSNKYILDITIKEHNPVDKSRNELVEEAMKRNPDYIMFIDSDNLVAKETLDQLIKVMNEKDADLVTALYFQKGKPYLPVIREFKYGGFWNIENPELNKVISIDGCGLGCCLINPRVFKKIEKPYFNFSYERWGKRDIQLSEDLWFCRKLLKKNMRMYCDTGLISSHIGGTVDIFEFMAFKDIRNKLVGDREEIMTALQEFTKRNELELTQDIQVGPKLIKDEWNEKLPKANDEIKKFYKETKNYIYDLTLWHMTTRREFDLEVIEKISQLKPKNILDFGCGTGMNSFMLSKEKFDVTLADLESYTLSFAEFLLKRSKLPYKVWKTDIEENPPDKKYDVILAFDVLEHLPKEELKIVVEKLIKLKHKDTHVIITYSPGKDVGGIGSHPMHFDADEEIEKLIKRLIKEVPNT